MLNVTIMTGRLVEEPELRYTKSDIPVTSCRLAVKRDYAKKEDDNGTDFFDVVAWRATAEFICKNFKKGSMIQIVGRFENRRWTDKHDQNRVSTELVAERVYFGDSKTKDDSSGDIYPFEEALANKEQSPKNPPPDFDPFG